MEKLYLLKRMLINSSVGTSAVRMQGNGIAEPIRQKLIKELFFEDLFTAIKNEDPKIFDLYLEQLTNKFDDLLGESKNGKEPGVVRWGTARKCINLVLRSTVYNGYIWNHYGLSNLDFEENGIMNKLEIPLDSHVVKGIKEDAKKYSLGFETKKYSTFSIIGLNATDKTESAYYQSMASKIAKSRKVCRIDLDLYYWRKQNEYD